MTTCEHSMISQVGRLVDGTWEWTGWRCDGCPVRFGPIEEIRREERSRIIKSLRAVADLYRPLVRKALHEEADRIDRIFSTDN